MRVLGVDLAWGEGGDGKAANETGVVAADLSGRILDAGWVRGVDETIGWMVASEVFDVPTVGPHRVMRRALT